MGTPGQTPHPAPRTAMVVLAGGSGRRLGKEDANKVYLPVAGRPLLTWSLAAFQRSPLIDDVVLVVRAGDEAAAQAAAAVSDKIRTVVVGGSSRHRSEWAGLEALAPAVQDATVGWVGVHDAARPFVSEGLLRRVLTAAQSAGGAVPTLPLAGLVALRVLHEGRPAEAVPTAGLRRAQTPQIFAAQPLLAAHRAARAAGFEGADTASCVERFGTVEVRAVQGDPRNVKVTVPADLERAAAVAAAWREG